MESIINKETMDGAFGVIVHEDDHRNLGARYLVEIIKPGIPRALYPLSETECGYSEGRFMQELSMYVNYSSAKGEGYLSVDAGGEPPRPSGVFNQIILFIGRFTFPHEMSKIQAVTDHMLHVYLEPVDGGDGVWAFLPITYEQYDRITDSSIPFNIPGEDGKMVPGSKWINPDRGRPNSIYIHETCCPFKVVVWNRTVENSGGPGIATARSNMEFNEPTMSIDGINKVIGGSNISWGQFAEEFLKLNSRIAFFENEFAQIWDVVSDSDGAPSTIEDAAVELDVDILDNPAVDMETFNPTWHRFAVLKDEFEA